MQFNTTVDIFDTKNLSDIPEDFRKLLKPIGVMGPGRTTSAAKERRKVVEAFFMLKTHLTDNEIMAAYYRSTKTTMTLNQLQFTLKSLIEEKKIRRCGRRIFTNDMKGNIKEIPSYKIG